jgi:ABC-type nickel/cobalt efflux system permease component RcnA
MRRYVSNMNPLVRGLAIVALVALVVVVLQLQATLTALFLLARIAFFLAAAVFVYMLWRERREDIGNWSQRAQWTFYGAAGLLFADVGWFVLGGGHAGLDALAFVLVLAAGAYGMFRVWRDQHTYS